MSSLEDSLKKRIAKCRREHEIIYKQLPVLLEKMESLFPTGNKMENSEEAENKSETKKEVAQLRPLTPAEVGERYKDLEETIKGFFKDLDEAEKETGGTSQAAATPRHLQWKTSNNQDLQQHKEGGLDLHQEDHPV